MACLSPKAKASVPLESLTNSQLMPSTAFKPFEKTGAARSNSTNISIELPLLSPVGATPDHSNGQV